MELKIKMYTIKTNRIMIINHNFSKQNLINESAQLPWVQLRRTVPLRTTKNTFIQRMRCCHVYTDNCYTVRISTFRQNFYLFVGSLDVRNGSNSSSELKKNKQTKNNFTLSLEACTVIWKCNCDATVKKGLLCWDKVQHRTVFLKAVEYT